MDVWERLVPSLSGVVWGCPGLEVVANQEWGRWDALDNIVTNSDCDYSRV